MMCCFSFPFPFLLTLFFLILFMLWEIFHFLTYTSSFFPFIHSLCYLLSLARLLLHFHTTHNFLFLFYFSFTYFFFVNFMNGERERRRKKKRMFLYEGETPSVYWLTNTKNYSFEIYIEILFSLPSFYAFPSYFLF